jgi:hypothetical protein
MADKRRPFSPWRSGIEIVLGLVLLNVIATLYGDLNIRFYADLSFVALGTAVLVAWRLWPDKIKFRHRVD